MKHILPFVFLTLGSTSVFAVPEEVRPWDEYLSIRVAEEATKIEILELSTKWTLACGREAGELVGKIVSAAPGNDGRTLLLDSQMVQVLVVGPNGSIEGTIGRPGDGPGDMPGAYRAFQLHDGRVGVSNGAPAPAMMYGGMGKTILFDSAGDPDGFWYGAGDPGTRPISTLRELRCANDFILSASQHIEMGDSGMVSVLDLATLDSVKGERSLIARLVNEDDMKKVAIREADIYEPFSSGRCDISAEGRIAMAPVRGEWLVVVREPDGSGFILERPWVSFPRTSAQLEAAQKAIGSSDQNGLLRDQPAVGRIRWRPNGNLWVEASGVDLPRGVFACFDEIDPSGVLLRRVHIVAPGNRKHDRLIVMEDGRFALLKGFDKVTYDDADEFHDAEVVLLEGRD